MNRAWMSVALLTLVLVACSGSGEQFVQSPISVQTSRGWAVRGWVRVLPASPDTVRFEITVANLLDTPVRYAYNGCDVSARAYRTAAPRAVPVWDSNRLPPDISGCIGGHDENPARTIAPGDTLPTSFWTLDLPVSAILGDSLPEGEYHFRVNPPLEVGTLPNPTPNAEGLYRVDELWPQLYLPVGSIRLERL